MTQIYNKIPLFIRIWFLEKTRLILYFVEPWKYYIYNSFPIINLQMQCHRRIHRSSFLVFAHLNCLEINYAIKIWSITVVIYFTLKRKLKNFLAKHKNSKLKDSKLQWLAPYTSIIFCCISGETLYFIAWEFII